jgi:4-hydroxy-tetrahydrodipicolinate synthase
VCPKNYMAALTAQFKGVIPPVCTPFTEDFEVDTASLEKLIEFLLNAGVDGLFMLGSTSETALLTDKQRATVLEVAVKTVANRVPVLSGVIDTTTARSIEQARMGERMGVNGLVLTAPFYIKVNQAEIIEHFRYVRAAVNLPIIAYDIPSAVQVKIERETLLQMAQEGIIVGLKDSSGDESNFRGVVMDRQQASLANFSIFTGSELLIDSLMLLGADGIVPGLGNVDPVGYVRLFKACSEKDWASALQEQERLYRLFTIIKAGTPGRMGFTASALGGFKTALMLRGVIATNIMGRPMTRYNSQEVERVRKILVEAGLL